MNLQETQQVIARDEKWVSSTERVKISSTNVILETTVHHKEETFQVVIYVIKNSTCFKAFTISADVPKIFMQQFWENIDYLELIWEDFTFQIDHNNERKSRRKTMPLPRFTKVIINHFLSQHKSLSNIKYQHYHTIKDDGIISRLKFVRIREDYQEYGLLIPDLMLNDAIKQSESYQMFLKYSTGQIPPKNSRGKGSQGKKTAYTPMADVDVSKEFDSKPAKKIPTSRRVVKKKVTISIVDNIILDPNVALELGKPISLTEASEEEAARQVHATHVRIVTKSVPEPARRRPSGAQSLTPEEQEVVDTMQALKESKKTSKRHPGSEGSSKGTGRIPRVPDGSKIISATSNEGIGTKPGVPNEEKKDDDDDDKSIDLEMTDDEETVDDFIHDDEQVIDNEDEKMTNAKVEESRKGDAEIYDVAKADAKNIEEIKDDAKKAELPPTTSSLSDTTDAEIYSLLDIKIQSEVPYIQSPFVLTIPVLVIYMPVVPTPIAEPPSVAPSTTLLPHLSVSTIPPVPHQTTEPIPTPPITTDAPTITTAVPESDALSAVQLRVAKLKKDVSKLKKIDHRDLIQKYFVKPAPESSKIQKPIIDLEQESEKSALEIRKIKKEQAAKQKMQKYTIKSTDKAALRDSLIENENAIDKEIARIHKETTKLDKTWVKYIKRQEEKNQRGKSFQEPISTTKETSKGKAPSKSSKTGKSATAKELVEESIVEVVMDDAVNTAGEDVVYDDDKPQYTSEPKTYKTLNQDWFKQPPRPPTLDPELNKRQVVLDQPKQPWFNQMVSATKDPLTFNDLIATPIDFSKYVLNRLKIDNLTQDLLLGLTYNLLNGTCHPVHLTIAADYFFNNDLEFLKTSNSKKTYTTSITKTKVAWYEITLWSTIKHAYDKDAEKGSSTGVKGSVSVKKLHGYGYLEEIMVKRADRQLYKFKEGDFVDLHLNDIEDMLLLAVQHKLFHLNDSELVDFIMALHMFIRSLIVKIHVEDLQLGVESYQKKLNIIAPQKTFLEIEFKELYTPSYKPPGVIYEDLNKQQ
ncbi:hypothetical protein Tco_0590698 [Tanacetum coccineum]